MTAQPHQQILDLTKLDPTLLAQVEEIIGEETPSICYQCNMCSGGCPVVDHMEYPPHMIMQMVRLGMTAQLLTSQAIWVCTLCLKCKERCPQHTSAVDSIWALRVLAIKKGFKIPPAYEAMAAQVSKTGNIYEILDLTDEDRESLDLPALPIPLAGYKIMLEKSGLFEALSIGKSLEKSRILSASSTDQEEPQ